MSTMSGTTYCLLFLLFLLAPEGAAIRRPWLSGKPTPLSLLSKTRVTNDTHVYRFGITAAGDDGDRTAPESSLFDDDQPNTLGIGVCSCLLVSPPSDPTLVRPYTPISSRHEDGSFVLLVKRYHDGMMGQHFQSLRVGDPLLFWQISKNIKEQFPFGNPRNIIMMAAGTGITPMYQALQRLFGKEEEHEGTASTRVTLLYGSRTKADAYLQKEMEDMERRFPDRLKIVHILSGRKSAGGGRWKSGRIDKSLIKDECTEALSDSSCRVWVCGPPSFYDELCGSRDQEYLPQSCVLRQLGLKSSQVVKF